MTNTKKIILFGSGRGGENFIEYYSSGEIIAIADNDPSKWDKKLLGYQIINPQDILKLEFDEIVITSQWIDSIKHQLIEELKISREKVIVNPKNLLKATADSQPFSHPKTLEVAQKTLINLTKFLDEQGIKAIADSGTALGIYREGEFLRWDDDIDLAIDTKDFEQVVQLAEQIKKILPKKYNAQWKLEILNLNDEDVCLSIFLKSPNSELVEFDLGLQKRRIKDGKSHLLSSAGMFDAPAHHFQNQVKVNYHNGFVYLPDDIEGFLTFMYGNWREPQKNTSFKDYENRVKLKEQSVAIVRKRAI